MFSFGHRRCLKCRCQKLVQRWIYSTTDVGVGLAIFFYYYFVVFSNHNHFSYVKLFSHFYQAWQNNHIFKQKTDWPEEGQFWSTSLLTSLTNWPASNGPTVFFLFKVASEQHFVDWTLAGSEPVGTRTESQFSKPWWTLDVLCSSVATTIQL